MSERELTLLGVGDIILDRPNAEMYFERVAPRLRAADVVVGQGEMPFTDRPAVTGAKSAIGEPTAHSPVCDPKNMNAFSYAGFGVIHLAGNHIWDGGIPGIEDTLAGLKRQGIAVVGAGMDLDEARRPALLERQGTRFGFLDYNCVGPKETWANPNKPGCAYVHVITAYELDHPTPGGGPTIYTFAEPKTLKAMVADITQLRSLCDVLVVCFHKGLGFVRAKLAMYEQPVAYAAIDAGADLVLAEHAHILKGIEWYKGRAIFHGLSDFVWPGRRRTGNESMSPALADERARKFREWFHEMPDPNETTRTVIAKCTIAQGKITRVGYLPCLINAQGQPEIVGRDARGEEVFAYMASITREADLNTRYAWDGDAVVAEVEDKERD